MHWNAQWIVNEKNSQLSLQEKFRDFFVADNIEHYAKIV